MSSLGKKYIMALTGLVLVGFAMGHMVGNMQMFLHPDWINEYAYKLQHLPYGILWIVRIVMLSCVTLHIAMAVLLVIENYRSRPEKYEAKAHMQASFASRTMKYSGIIVLSFIVFHIMHFTVQNIHPEFLELETELVGVGTMHHVYDKLQALGQIHVHDVYSMVVHGFSAQFWYVPVFYVIAMALLCLHLMHGITSMFQSLGLRNAAWRIYLDRAALIIALVVFVGFTSIPLASLLGLLEPITPLVAAH